MMALLINGAARNPIPEGRYKRYPEGEDAAVVALAWTERLNAVEARADAIVQDRAA